MKPSKSSEGSERSAMVSGRKLLVVIVTLSWVYAAIVPNGESRSISDKWEWPSRSLSTDRYYSHDEINDYIESLAKRFPQRVSVQNVGKSYEGRSMKTITITNGDGRTNKNVVLMDGGIHAGEWISPAAVVYAIEQLVENYENNTELLLDYDWVVLPVVNPDGYQYSRSNRTTRYWRQGRQAWDENGTTFYTDLNRNFDFEWEKSYVWAQNYSGPKPFSEPETIALRDLIHALSDRGQLYLTLHSCGRYILYPWGYAIKTPADNDGDLNEVAMAGAEAMKAANGAHYKVGTAADVLYPARGISQDYAMNAGFTTSFTLELPCHVDYEYLDEDVKETWTGIRAMAMKVVEKYPLEADQHPAN